MGFDFYDFLKQPWEMYYTVYYIEYLLHFFAPFFHDVSALLGSFPQFLSSSGHYILCVGQVAVVIYVVLL